MILFWTDPAAPGGWSRLERSITLGIHAVARRDMVVALPRNRGAEKYLAARRIAFVSHEQALHRCPQEIDLLVLDVAGRDRSAMQVTESCLLNRVALYAIHDPGDAAGGTEEVALGSWPPNHDPQSPPGPAWAILHPRFRHVNRLKRAYPRRARKLLLHLEDRCSHRGLSDLIDELWRQGFRLRVGPVSSIRDNLKRALSRKYPGLRWVGAAECMARPLLEADVAIVAPGAAALEAAAAGTPALYLSRTQAERDAAAKLESLGFGVAVTTSLSRSLEDLNHETLRRLGETGRNRVDARGLFRTLEFLRDRGHLPPRLNGA